MVKTLEITDQDLEIIESLKCKEIPDTRKLQEKRIGSIGEESGYEKHMRKGYPERFKHPRIVLLSPYDQKRVYSLAIPLTFPILDYAGHKIHEDTETRYGRWESGDGQKGAMHLTTEKNLAELVDIFSKNLIPMRPEVAFGPICGFRSFDRLPAGLSVPHSWYVESYDPDERLYRHQFVEWSQQLIGVPYYYISETTISKKEEKEGYAKTSRSVSKSDVTQREYFCRAVFYGSMHAKKTEKDVQEHLDKIAKEGIEDKNHLGNVLTVQNKLVKLGEPQVIYDPSWIENNYTPPWGRNKEW